MITEKKVWQKVYRRAMAICHPDRVPAHLHDSMEAKAKALNVAWAAGDFAIIRQIAVELGVNPIPPLSITPPPQTEQSQTQPPEKHSFTDAEIEAILNRFYKQIGYSDFDIWLARFMGKLSKKFGLSEFEISPEETFGMKSLYDLPPYSKSFLFRLLIGWCRLLIDWWLSIAGWFAGMSGCMCLISIIAILVHKPDITTLYLWLYSALVGISWLIVGYKRGWGMVKLIALAVFIANPLIVLSWLVGLP